jgi:hypothetical protein
MSAVRELIEHVGRPDPSFRDRRGELLSADRALRHKRDELAEQDLAQGWRASAATRWRVTLRKIRRTVDRSGKPGTVN